MVVRCYDEVKGGHEHDPMAIIAWCTLYGPVARLCSTLITIRLSRLVGVLQGMFRESIKYKVRSPWHLILMTPVRRLSSTVVEGGGKPETRRSHP